MLFVVDNRRSTGWCGQVEVVIDNQTIIGFTIDVLIIIVTLFDERSSVNRQTVVDEAVAPCQATLSCQVTYVTLFSVEVRVEVDRTSVVLLFCIVLTHVTDYTYTCLDVERQVESNVTSEHVPTVSVVHVALVEDSIRVVVEVGLEVSRALGVPSSPSTVRTLVVSIVIQIHLSLTPLQVFVVYVSCATVTFLCSIVVATVSVLIVQRHVHPFCRLVRSLHGQEATYGVRVLLDTVTSAVGERDTWVVILTCLRERHVGSVGNTCLEQVGHIQTMHPRLSLAILWTGFIVVERSSYHHACIVTCTPAFVRSEVHVVRTVRVHHFTILAIKELRTHGVFTWILVCYYSTVITVATTTILLLHVEVVVVLFPCQSVAYFEVTLTAFCLLGSNDNCTVTTLRTIKGSSCSTLQYVDGFHVVHVHCILVGDRTVHYVDRFATFRSQEVWRTTEHDSTCTECCTWSTEETGTGNLTCHSVTQVCLTGYGQLFTVYLLCWITDGLFLTGQTLSGYDHFVQSLASRLQHDLHHNTFLDGNYFGLQTYVRNHQVLCCWRYVVKIELTINVCNSTHGCSLNNHRSADYWKTILCRCNDTGYFGSLCRCHTHPNEQCGEHHKDSFFHKSLF